MERKLWCFRHLLQLASLAKLISLTIESERPRPRPNRARPRPPLQIRSVLALTRFPFNSAITRVSEYRESGNTLWPGSMLRAFLESILIAFFRQLIFGTPQLSQFISRTINLSALHEAPAVSIISAVQVKFPQLTRTPFKRTCHILCFQYC
jgi:hypothetical protein